MTTKETKRRLELRERLKEARKARKNGLPGENPKKLLGALKVR